MSNPAKPDGALPPLHQAHLLDTIDKIRALGLGEVVSLTQMIICGSKSNGKRSVIEAKSRVEFPVKNDHYTGFVTEIILRRRPTTCFKVSIETGLCRKSEKDLQRVKAFKPTAHPNAEQSASIIGKAMEFLGPSTEDRVTDDIVKVEFSGPE